MFFNDASGFEEGYAKKDSLEIYYRDYGPADGIPVLLVMGYLICTCMQLHSFKRCTYMKISSVIKVDLK